MKSHKVVITFLFLILVIEPQVLYSQKEENETSESIMQREQFIYDRRAGGPGKLISPDAWQNAFVQMMQVPKDKNTGSFTSVVNWVSVNPTGMFYSVTGNNYISGRTNSIVAHPTNPLILYIGSAQGGAWKTTDGGQNWVVLTDGLPNIACGDIAIDRNYPNVLYLGTGEQNYSLDSFYGNGIWKTTDAGTTWVQVATSAIGSRFSQIVINPVNSNIVYAAGSNGVYKSTNAGLNWTNYPTSGLYSNCLIINPLNPQVLIESAGGINPCTIRKSYDGGLTWITLTGGLPATMGRIQLAMAPSDTSIIYASISQPLGELQGLYKSTNGGLNWVLKSSSPNYMGSQGWYDNAIVVHPTNPNMVIVGGLDIYSSTNSGVTLSQKTTWYTASSVDFAHADIHSLKYFNGVLYCCSDGGVFKSTNDGSAWSDLNRTLSTLQYQGADYDPSNIQNLYGGCQDNDKETSTNGGTNWIQRATGDGGYTIVDPVNPDFIYSQYVNGSLDRSNNKGLSFVGIEPLSSTGGLFYNPFEMAPGDHNTIVYAQSDIWKTSTAQTCSNSAGWVQIGTTAAIGGNVSAIGISAQNTAKIYAGTSSGKILVTTNNGANWLNRGTYSYITDFAVDVTNDAVCYASIGGTGAIHVVKTTNYGANWTDITGILPHIAVNSVVLRVTNPRMIFAGTDMGVFQSTNEGASWVSFSSSMPTVQIYDLKYKEINGILLAGTHGRGCWTFNVAATIGVENNSEVVNAFKLSQNYPNPFNPSTLISFELPKEANVKLTIFDILGKELAVLSDGNRNPGHHSVVWDAAKFSSGIYFYKIEAGSFIETKRMVLVK